MGRRKALLPSRNARLAASPMCELRLEMLVLQQSQAESSWQARQGKAGVTPCSAAGTEAGPVAGHGW